MELVGWILTIGGVLLSLVGIAILALGTYQLYRQMFNLPAPAAAPAGGAAAAPTINLADLAKLIEAIIKIPQWLLALLAADVQIYFGYMLAKGSRLF